MLYSGACSVWKEGLKKEELGSVIDFIENVSEVCRWHRSKRLSLWAPRFFWRHQFKSKHMLAKERWGALWKYKLAEEEELSRRIKEIRDKEREEQFHLNSDVPGIYIIPKGILWLSSWCETCRLKLDRPFFMAGWSFISSLCEDGACFCAVTS